MNTFKEMRKNLDVSIIVSGIKDGKKALNITPRIMGFGDIKTAFNYAGLEHVRTVEQDLSYYITSWDKYKEALDLSYQIVKQFPWRAEVFDCDNRSSFMNVLMSVFGLTCGRVHGTVYKALTGEKKYLHWFNCVIDDKKDVYIFDADNGGKWTKVDNPDQIIIGGNRYEINQAIFN